MMDEAQAKIPELTFESRDIILLIQTIITVFTSKNGCPFSLEVPYKASSTKNTSKFKNCVSTLDASWQPDFCYLGLH
jgi:hypothetical protein